MTETPETPATPATEASAPGIRNIDHELNTWAATVTGPYDRFFLRDLAVGTRLVWTGLDGTQDSEEIVVLNDVTEVTHLVHARRS